MHSSPVNRVLERLFTRRRLPLSTQLGILAAQLSTAFAELLGGRGLKVKHPGVFVHALGYSGLIIFFKSTELEVVGLNTRTEAGEILDEALTAEFQLPESVIHHHLKEIMLWYKDFEQRLLNSAESPPVFADEIGQWILRQGEPSEPISAGLVRAVGGASMDISLALAAVATGRSAGANLPSRAPRGNAE